MSDITKRLRDTAQGIDLGADGMGWSPDRCLYSAAADEIDRLRAEVAKLKTVMVAAAEEIATHWESRCDAEGYGPANLQRRLEEGIPSEYGYTAGAFASLRAEVEALRLKLKTCGGENCMGWRAGGVTQWVTADSVEALRAALQEADTIMSHDDDATEWREKWAGWWPNAKLNGGP